MIFLANFIVFITLTALVYTFKAIEWVWGAETMMVFALGWIAATVIWQRAHKSRYGHWFDPPVITPPVDPNERASNLAMSGEICTGGADRPPPAIKL